MTSQTNLRIAESSPTDLVVAHYKRPDYHASISDLASRSGYRYMFSPVDEVRTFLEFRKEKGDIDLRRPLLVAGCGDYRVGALAASMGIRTVGVEEDEQLMHIAADNISELVTRGIIEQKGAKILAGDFTKDETYIRRGMNFRDFATIFNYNVGTAAHEGLVRKILAESEIGTTILLVTKNPDWERAGLDNEKLRMIRGLRINGIDSKGRPKLPLYARVYKKTK
jgi:hypothetical protein